VADCPGMSHTYITQPYVGLDHHRRFTSTKSYRLLLGDSRTRVHENNLSKVVTRLYDMTGSQTRNRVIARA